MRILVANRHLVGVGGSETFAYSLIEQLIKTDEVEYFCIHRGVTSKKIEALGVKFARSLNYDIIIASQRDTVAALWEMRLTGPIIQVCHGCMTPGEQPHPDADGYIAISEEVASHLKNQGIDAPVVLNGIDCTRFRPIRKPRKKLKVVASMVQSDEAHQMVVAAAKRLGLEVIRLNKYKDRVWEVEKEINKADLVVSLGRGCYEAMACGRPVVVFDKRKYQAQLADGYLHPKAFEHLVKNNCSGRYSNLTLSVDDLVNEFEKYDASHGSWLREIALEHLNIEKQSLRILMACCDAMEDYRYPGKTDVVYVLGKGSGWGDNEIRYSIRSFVKHFKDLRNIVVVGECPVWLRGVLHIPFPDNMNLNKDARMLQKLAAACRDSRVSDRFVFCLDDSFLNADLSFSDFTGWHEGKMMYHAEADLAEHRSVGLKNREITPSTWFNYVYATGEELQARGLPDNNYDRAHCPQPIDKKEFLEVLEEWDIVNNRYTCSNVYLNSTFIFPGEDIRGKNGKIYNPMTMKELRDYLSDKITFNINDHGLTDVLKDYLQELFPEASKHELFATATDKRQAVEDWFKKGCDYDEGVAIVAQFAPKNRRIQIFLSLKRGMPVGDLKLKKTLRLWLR